MAQGSSGLGKRSRASGSRRTGKGGTGDLGQMGLGLGQGEQGHVKRTRDTGSEAGRLGQEPEGWACSRGWPIEASYEDVVKMAKHCNV